MTPHLVHPRPRWVSSDMFTSWARRNGRVGAVPGCAHTVPTPPSSRPPPVLGVSVPACTIVPKEPWDEPYAVHLCPVGIRRFGRATWCDRGARPPMPFTYFRYGRSYGGKYAFQITAFYKYALNYSRCIEEACGPAAACNISQTVYFEIPACSIIFPWANCASFMSSEKGGIHLFWIRVELWIPEAHSLNRPSDSCYLAQNN